MNIRFPNLKARFVDLKGDAFIRNLFLSFSGGALAQVIGFAFTPLITRVFSPLQYGLFALFFSIASNLSTLSTLQLPAGFVSARSKTELNSMIRVSFMSLLIVSIFLLLVVVFFRDGVAAFWDAQHLGMLMYLIPLQVFILGLDYILLGWSISLKQFSRGAWGRVLSILAGKGFTLGYGLWIAPSAYGLVVGNMLISMVDSAVKMSRAIRDEIGGLVTRGGWPTTWGVLKQYRSYPLLVMPGIFVVGISQQLPLYVFSQHFDKGTVGYYALASSVIVLPLQMITTPVTSVFLQRAAELQHTDKAKLSHLVYQLHQKLFLISFASMALLILISDWIFAFVFGPDWRGAGAYASMIAVFTILSVPVQPISVLFRLLHVESRNLIINVCTLGARFVALMTGIYFENPMIGLAGFTFVSILSSGASLLYLFSLAGIKRGRLIPYLVLVLIIFVFALWRAREWFI
jgi:O-antigen/teichoic acid export membrane protein